MDASETQTKFILERINATEKNFLGMHGAILSVMRQDARVRDKHDLLAKVFADYGTTEAFNLTTAQGLNSLAKAATLLADMKDLEIKRLSSKVTSELGQYEGVCKRMRDSIKESMVVRDKEIQRNKRVGRKPEMDIVKTQLDTTRILREIEKQMESFEQRKLQDLKGILQDYVLIQLKMHSGAVELLTSAYQDIAEIDEKADLQQIKKHLSRKEDMLGRIHRLRSQSMGALSSMFAAGGHSNPGLAAEKTKKSAALKTQSSTSLNSANEQSDSQDQEDDLESEDSDDSEEDSEQEEEDEEDSESPVTPEKKASNRSLSSVESKDNSRGPREVRVLERVKETPKTQEKPKEASRSLGNTKVRRFSLNL